MTNRERLGALASAATVPSGWTEESIERNDYLRIRFALYMAIAAESVPRRLGREADRGALAADKRTARMVANAYRSLWMAVARLGAQPAPTWESRDGRIALLNRAEPAMRQAGATVIWSPWLTRRVAELEARRSQVAAFAVGANLMRWGSKRVRLLESEIANIKRIEEELK